MTEVFSCCSQDILDRIFHFATLRVTLTAMTTSRRWRQAACNAAKTVPGIQPTSAVPVESIFKAMGGLVAMQHVQHLDLTRIVRSSPPSHPVTTFSRLTLTPSITEPRPCLYSVVSSWSPHHVCNRRHSHPLGLTTLNMAGMQLTPGTLLTPIPVPTEL